MGNQIKRANKKNQKDHSKTDSVRKVKFQYQLQNNIDLQQLKVGPNPVKQRADTLINKQLLKIQFQNYNAENMLHLNAKQNKQTTDYNILPPKSKLRKYIILQLLQTSEQCAVYKVIQHEKVDLIEFLNDVPIKEQIQQNGLNIAKAKKMMFRYKFYNFKVINSLCKTLSYMKESHTIGYCDIEEYFIEAQQLQLHGVYVLNVIYDYSRMKSLVNLERLRRAIHKQDKHGKISIIEPNIWEFVSNMICILQDCHSKGIVLYLEMRHFFVDHQQCQYENNSPISSNKQKKVDALKRLNKIINNVTTCNFHPLFNQFLDMQMDNMSLNKIQHLYDHAKETSDLLKAKIYFKFDAITKVQQKSIKKQRQTKQDHHQDDLMSRLKTNMIYSAGLLVLSLLQKHTQAELFKLSQFEVGSIVSQLCVSQCLKQVLYKWLVSWHNLFMASPDYLRFNFEMRRLLSKANSVGESANANEQEEEHVELEQEKNINSNVIQEKIIYFFHKSKLHLACIEKNTLRHPPFIVYDLIKQDSQIEQHDEVNVVSSCFDEPEKKIYFLHEPSMNKQQTSSSQALRAQRPFFQISFVSINSASINQLKNQNLNNYYIQSEESLQQQESQENNQEIIKQTKQQDELNEKENKNGDISKSNDTVVTKQNSINYIIISDLGVGFEAFEIFFQHEYEGAKFLVITGIELSTRLIKYFQINLQQPQQQRTMFIFDFLQKPTLRIIDNHNREILNVFDFWFCEEAAYVWFRCHIKKELQMNGGLQVLEYDRDMLFRYEGAFTDDNDFILLREITYNLQFLDANRAICSFPLFAQRFYVRPKFITDKYVLFLLYSEQNNLDFQVLSKGEQSIQMLKCRPQIFKCGSFFQPYSQDQQQDILNNNQNIGECLKYEQSITLEFIGDASDLKDDNTQEQIIENLAGLINQQSYGNILYIANKLFFYASYEDFVAIFCYELDPFLKVLQMIGVYRIPDQLLSANSSQLNEYPLAELHQDRFSIISQSESLVSFHLSYKDKDMQSKIEMRLDQKIIPLQPIDNLGQFKTIVLSDIQAIFDAMNHSYNVPDQVRKILYLPEEFYFRLDSHSETINLMLYHQKYECNVAQICESQNDLKIGLKQLTHKELLKVLWTLIEIFIYVIQSHPDDYSFRLQQIRISDILMFSQNAFHKNKKSFKIDYQEQIDRNTFDMYFKDNNFNYNSTQQMQNSSSNNSLAQSVKKNDTSDNEINLIKPNYQQNKIELLSKLNLNEEKSLPFRPANPGPNPIHALGYLFFSIVFPQFKNNASLQTINMITNSALNKIESIRNTISSQQQSTSSLFNQSHTNVDINANSNNSQQQQQIYPKFIYQLLQQIFFQDTNQIENNQGSDNLLVSFIQELLKLRQKIQLIQKENIRELFLQEILGLDFILKTTSINMNKINLHYFLNETNPQVIILNKFSSQINRKKIVSSNGQQQISQEQIIKHYFENESKTMYGYYLESCEVIIFFKLPIFPEQDDINISLNKQKFTKKNDNEIVMQVFQPPLIIQQGKLDAQSVEFIACDGDILQVGGISKSYQNYRKATLSNKCFSFKKHDKKWEPIGDLNTARVHPGLYAINDTIYVFGGEPFRQTWQNAAYKIEVLNKKQYVWDEYSVKNSDIYANLTHWTSGYKFIFALDNHQDCFFLSNINEPSGLILRVEHDCRKVDCMEVAILGTSFIASQLQEIQARLQKDSDSKQKLQNNQQYWINDCVIKVQDAIKIRFAFEGMFVFFSLSEIPLLYKLKWQPLPEIIVVQELKSF